MSVLKWIQIAVEVFKPTGAAISAVGTRGLSSFLSLTRWAVLPPVVLVVLAGCQQGVNKAGGDTSQGPAFDTTVDAQTYTVNTAITPLVLPAANGGVVPLTYDLRPDVPGLRFAPSTRTLSGTPTTAGLYEMTYRATDASGEDASLLFTVTVEAGTPDPGPPSFDTTVDAQTYTVNTAITPLVLPAANGGVVPLTYDLRPDVPGLRFAPSTRTLSGTPTTAGLYEMTYRATDAGGEDASLLFTVTVEAGTPDPGPPSFDTTVDAQTYTVNTAITPLVLPAANGGVVPLTYDLRPDVPGLRFAPSTRTLSGTPTTAGLYEMTYRATDASGEGASLLFTISVMHAVPTTLSLTASGIPAEGDPAVTVTATLDQPAPAGGTTVTLIPSGTAGTGTDYTLTPTTFTIAAGQKAGTATIWVIDDSVDDDDETIVIDASSTNPALTATQVALTIIDNDVASSAHIFMVSCPTPAEVAGIDRELELRFVDDPTAGEPLACSEDSGSVDLTVIQMGAYQTLRLMKIARFSEPLPWTRDTLWEWLVATIDGIEFDANVENSFCCRGNNIVIKTDIKLDSNGAPVEGPAWIFAYSNRMDAGMAGLRWVQLFVHEARHAEGAPHTCGIGNDATFAEMGAWAYVYYTWLWFEQKFLPADFFGPEARDDMEFARRITCDHRICAGDCPGG